MVLERFGTQAPGLRVESKTANVQLRQYTEERRNSDAEDPTGFGSQHGASQVEGQQPRANERGNEKHGSVTAIGQRPKQEAQNDRRPEDGHRFEVGP